MFKAKLGRMRREIAKLCLSFCRHCEERSDEAIHSSILLRAMDCFASLAMTFIPVVIVRESGRSSIPERCDWNREAAAYWFPASAGMTAIIGAAQSAPDDGLREAIQRMDTQKWIASSLGLSP
jgi:hypothetical protein